MPSFLKKYFHTKWLIPIFFYNEDQEENFVQRDFNFLKEPLNHNIDNNNIETKIDRNIDENQRASNNREITTHTQE